MGSMRGAIGRRAGRLATSGPSCPRRRESVHSDVPAGSATVARLDSRLRGNDGGRWKATMAPFTPSPRTWSGVHSAARGMVRGSCRPPVARWTPDRVRGDGGQNDRPAHHPAGAASPSISRFHTGVMHAVTWALVRATGAQASRPAHIPASSAASPLHRLKTQCMSPVRRSVLVTIRSRLAAHRRPVTTMSSPGGSATGVTASSSARAITAPAPGPAGSRHCRCPD